MTAFNGAVTGGHRRGVWHTAQQLKALDFRCPYCHAIPGMPCQDRFHDFRAPHISRTSQVGNTYTTTPAPTWTKDSEQA